MKKIIFFFLITLFVNFSYAQNVTINPSGITPAGTSYPRLSYSAILALSNPQAGDLAYDNTYNCLRVYVGTKWLRIVTDNFPNPPTGTAFSTNVTIKFIEVDNLGNVYVFGIFKETVNIGGTSITSFGDNDVFLAKFSSTGIFDWVRKAGGTAGDVVNAITVDMNGDIILSGYFFNNMDFDGTILPYSGNSNLFFAKYSSTGVFSWAKSVTGSGIKVPNAITTDSNGDIYATGYFSGGSAVFATASSSITLNASSKDAFVVKFNSTGVTQWAKSISGLSDVLGTDIKVYNNDLFVNGTFDGNATFSNTFSMGSAGSSDAFLSKYNKNTGDFTQAVSLGGSQLDEASKFAITTTGDIIVAANVYSAISVPGGTLTPAGNSDCLYVKYNPALVLQWGKMFGGTQIDEITDLKLDASNNIHLIGKFNGSLTNTLGVFTSAGDSDVFLAKASAGGDLIWFNKYGASLTDVGTSLVVKNGIYAAGNFNGTVSFGTSVLTAAGTGSGFVMKVVE